MRTLATAFCLVLALPAMSRADEEPAEDSEASFDVPPPKQVIQNRKYDLLHEVSFLTGVLPVDPYYKGVTGTFGYALHFSQDWAWEIAQFTYSFNIDTSLKRKLLELAAATGQTQPALEEINWILASHLVLKPLYGKEALFNTEVVHLEAFLQLGPAVVKKTQVTGLAFGGDFGAGLRLWLTPTWSVRLDMGELIYIESAADSTHVRQTMHMHLGVAMNLRGED